MAIVKTEAIILRRQEVRETSLLLIAFTRDLGKIQGLVKGVRGVGTAVPWYLEPLTLQSIVLYERKRSSTSLISACDLIDAFEPIRRDFVKVSYASLCLDLVDALTEILDPHPEIFELLLGALKALAQEGDPRSVARYLEAQLLKASGLLPEGKSLALSPGGTLSLEQIFKTPPDRIGRLRLSRAVEEELKATLYRLLLNAVGRPLKSRNFLQAVALEGLNGS